MHDLKGTTLGQYTIGEQLGRGGMANVYKAHHAGLDVHRAVKVIRPDLTGSGNFDERFQREARAVAGLRHPNIVQVHDFGRHEELFYMVMELVEGEDLKERIKRLGPVRPFAEALRIFEQLASALGYAHENNVLHRDVKPDNILLSNSGDVILTDFGIAKILGSDDPQLTATGAEIGTPTYMAPELAMGRVRASVASDLYAAGVVLYAMLTARVPFAADTPLAVLHKVLHDPIPPPRDFNEDIPEALQNVVLKAMAFEPEQRYPDAAALIEAGRQSLLGVGPTPESDPAPATRPMLSRAVAASAAEKAAADAAPASTAPVEAPAAGGGTLLTAHESTSATAAPPAAPRQGRRDLLVAGGLALALLLLLGFAGVAGWRWLQGDDTQVHSLAALESIPATQRSDASVPAQEAPAAPSDSGDSTEVEADTTQPATEGAAQVPAAPIETFAAGRLPASAPPQQAPSEPLGRSDSDSRLHPPAETERVPGEPRDRAESREAGAGLPPLPTSVTTQSRSYSGGEIRFAQPMAGTLDPEDTIAYDLEVRRPTHIYLDIFASRPATFTLHDAQGQVVFRQQSDLGPFYLDAAGWYRLSIETDAAIPIDYEVEFLEVGG